jgi:spermidine synthase
MMPRRAILPLYFFSGVSALVYEIVWARMLGLIVGAAVGGWAAVLVAYMGGMALGSFFGGRIADRARRPLIVFALCEASIGIFGAVSPAMLHLVQKLCAGLPLLFGTSTGAYSVTRLIIAVGVLIIPTMLMGATFPIISRVVAAKDRPFGRDLGVIYAANTIGAIFGTMAAGFFLLPALGMSVSLLMAAIINCSVAGWAIFLARRYARAGAIDASVKSMEKYAVQRPLPAWLFPAALVCSGFCAMAFEVLWSRALVFFLTSTTYAFTTVLSVMLAGLAVGGLIAAAIAKKRRDPAAWLAALLLCIGVWGFASPFLLHALDPAIHVAESRLVHVWWQWIAVRYAVCFAVVFPPALCMGAIYPLAIGASCRSVDTAGRAIGSLSSLNTLGGIAGSLAAAFLLIPAIGIQRSLVVVAIINCIGGLTVMGSGLRNSRKRTIAGAVATLVMGVACLTFSGYHPMVLYSRAISDAEGPVSLVSYKEDRVASVAVIKNDRGRTLNIDGFNAAGTYRYEYMHLLAHLPILLSPSPDTALVICFGTGTTCGTVAVSPSVKRVDCAEISPAVVASARYFTDVNYHAAENPKVRFIIDDGRNYLLRSPRRYNVITLEPMHPYLASATNLYSADFYKLCRSRLAAHGVMAQWAPLHVLSPTQYRMLIAGFASVFSHTSLWFLGTEGILIGSLDSLRIDIPALKRNMSADGVESDLAKISVAEPERLLSCFLMGERQIHEFVKDVPALSDDRPRIEFSAPRNLVRPADLPWLENMEELLVRRVSVLPFVSGADAAASEGIQRCSRASSMIMKAAMMNSRQQFFQALISADSALTLMPGDTTARMIRREAMDNATLLCLNGARGLRSQGLLSPAEATYLRALAIDSSCVPAHTELATLYATLGMVDKSLEHAQKAVVFSPNDPAMRTNLAVVYMNLNRTAEAEAELLRAIGIDEKYGRAHYFLGMLYDETGRREIAQAARKRAEKLGYRPRPQ